MFVTKSDIEWILMNAYKIGFLPLLVYIVQNLMSKFLFCRKVKSARELKNMKLYHITIYFNLFHNFCIGLFSFVFRYLTAFFICALFMGRIDRYVMLS